jgi:DNA-directed RNA polymerase specialized sigma subunit, sigma24 homolog
MKRNTKDLRPKLPALVKYEWDSAEQKRSDDILISNTQQESSMEFEARFSRCHRLLSFIACRVLGGNEGVDEAVQNCRLMASRNPPRFEYEGAFRSWLLRILIDEALVVLRKCQPVTRSGQEKVNARNQSFQELTSELMGTGPC